MSTNPPIINTDQLQVAVKSITAHLGARKCADVIFQGYDLVFTTPLYDGAVLVALGPDDSPSRTYYRFLPPDAHRDFVKVKLGLSDEQEDIAELVEKVVSKF